MKKILAIDDEQDYIFMLKVNLETGGEFQVLTAENGMDGIRSAKTHEPDLILLDIMMPGLDGLDTLKILKEDNMTFRIPVIMLTAKDDDQSKMMAHTMFDDGYMVKPVEMKALKEKIRSVIARHERSGQKEKGA